MILENAQERAMLEEILDVILKAQGKGALNVAQYLLEQMRKYDNKSKGESPKEEAEQQ